MRHTRRFVLHCAALVLGAGVLALIPASAARAPRPGREPILSLDTYSLRDLYRSRKLTLEDTPALLRELKIKGITFNDMFFGDRLSDKAYLDMLKKAVKDNGRIVTGFIIEGNLATADEDARRRQIELNKEKMKAAAYLGAPVCRINIGGTGGGPEQDATVGVERVISAFKELLPLAKQLNLKITIENHGGVSAKADNTLKIIKGTDPNWVGSCLDFGNWPADIRYEECQKLAPYAYHVHAKAYSFDDRGEETRMDYGRLLGMLKAAKYKWAVSIEFEGRGDPIEGVKKTRDLILKHWPEVRTD